jgi:hypothetical protein
MDRVVSLEYRSGCRAAVGTFSGIVFSNGGLSIIKWPP